MVQKQKGETHRENMINKSISKEGKWAKLDISVLLQNCERFNKLFTMQR